MPWTDILSPAIVIAVVVLLWRDTNSRIAALGATVAALAATVADVDRRLATLEGRITGWRDQRHGTAEQGARRRLRHRSMWGEDQLGTSPCAEASGPRAP